MDGADGKANVTCTLTTKKLIVGNHENEAFSQEGRKKWGTPSQGDGSMGKATHSVKSGGLLKTDSSGRQ